MPKDKMLPPLHQSMDEPAAPFGPALQSMEGRIEDEPLDKMRPPSVFTSTREYIWRESYKPRRMTISDDSDWVIEKSYRSFAYLMTPTLKTSLCCDQYLLQPMSPDGAAYQAANWTCGSFFFLGCCISNTLLACPISTCMVCPSTCCIGFGCTCSAICCSPPDLLPPTSIVKKEIEPLIKEKNLPQLLHALHSYKTRHSLSADIQEQILYLAIAHPDSRVRPKTRMQIFNYIAPYYLPYQSSRQRPRPERADNLYLKTYEDVILVLLKSNSSYLISMLQLCLTNDSGRGVSPSKVSAALLDAYEKKLFNIQQIEKIAKLFDPYCLLNDPRIIEIRNQAARPIVVLGLFKNEGTFATLTSDAQFDRQLIPLMLSFWYTPSRPFHTEPQEEQIADKENIGGRVITAGS